MSYCTPPRSQAESQVRQFDTLLSARSAGSYGETGQDGELRIAEEEAVVIVRDLRR